MLEHIRSGMKNNKDAKVLLEWVEWLVKDTDLHRTWVNALQDSNAEFNIEWRKALDQRDKALEVLEGITTMEINPSNLWIALGIIQEKSRKALSLIRKMGDDQWKR